MNETGSKSPGSLSERVRSLRLTDSSEAAGSAWSWMPWALCAVLLLVSGVLALEAFSPPDDETIKKLAEERGLNVGKGDGQTTSLGRLVLPGSSESAATEVVLESKGYIVPISLIQVSPKVSGTVMKLNIKEGMLIKTDNFVLAELEEIEYKSDLDRAIGVKKAAEARWQMLWMDRPAEERQAKAELDDAKAQYDPAVKEYNRAMQLKQSGTIAPKDYESAEGAYRSMKSRMERLQLAYDLLRKGPRDRQIDAALAECKQAEADYVKAKWRFENTRVKAPIKGMVLSKKTEEGNMVNPAAFSNGLSASLCEMADLHELEVDLSIAERDIARLFKDQDCRIRAEAFPDRIYRGYISRIMPMGDRSKSSVPVRVKIDFPAVDARGQPLPKDEQGQYLRPEMGAIVTFLNRKAPGK